MAVTVTTNAVAAGSRAAFSSNATSEDFSSTEIAVAAVTGKTHYVQQVIISNGGTARTVTIGAGETTNEVTTVLLGPVSCAANSTQTFKFAVPISAGSATDVTVDASGASAGSCVHIQGYTE